MRVIKQYVQPVYSRVIDTSKYFCFLCKKKRECDHHFIRWLFRGKEKEPSVDYKLICKDCAVRYSI